MQPEQLQNQEKLLQKQFTATLTIKQAHQNSIESVAAHPDGKQLASGSHDHLIKIWDLGSGKQQAKLSGHKQGVWSVVYSPDGKELLSGSCDSTLMIWDVRKGKPAKTLQGHKNKIYWAKYNENATLVASGGQASPVIIWDMKTGGIHKQLQTKSQVTYCVQWSKDGKYLATTQMDGTLTLFDTKTFAQVATAPGNVISQSRAYGCDLDFVSQPGRIFVATQDRHIKDFSFVENRLDLKKQHFAHFDAVKSLTLDGKRKMLISTGGDGSVRLWDTGVGLKALGNLVGHEQNVSKAVFVPTKELTIASGSWDQNINVWRLNL